jgi:hypothetical protein
LIFACCVSILHPASHRHPFFLSFFPQDPLAQIGILAILSPFVILGLAIAFGVVDLNGGR